MIQHYHLSPRQYSLAFSLNAASFFVAAQLNGWLAARLGLRGLVQRSSLGFAAVTLLLTLLFAAGIDHLWLLITLLCSAYAFLGMTVPTASILALENHGEIAGTASALMGTLQFGVGAALMLASGRFATGEPLP